MCRYKNMEIVIEAVCDDHVHLSVAITSKISVADEAVQKYIKEQAEESRKEDSRGNVLYSNTTDQ